MIFIQSYIYGGEGRTHEIFSKKYGETLEDTYRERGMKRIKAMSETLAKDKLSAEQTFGEAVGTVKANRAYDAIAAIKHIRWQSEYPDQYEKGLFANLFFLASGIHKWITKEGKDAFKGIGRTFGVLVSTYVWNQNPAKDVIDLIDLIGKVHGGNSLKERLMQKWLYGLDNSAGNGKKLAELGDVMYDRWNEGSNKNAIVSWLKFADLGEETSLLRFLDDDFKDKKIGNVAWTEENKNIVKKYHKLIREKDKAGATVSGIVEDEIDGRNPAYRNGWIFNLGRSTTTKTLDQITPNKWFDKPKIGAPMWDQVTVALKKFTDKASSLSKVEIWHILNKYTGWAFEWQNYPGAGNKELFISALRAARSSGDVREKTFILNRPIFDNHALTTFPENRKKGILAFRDFFVAVSDKIDDSLLNKEYIHRYEGQYNRADGKYFEENYNVKVDNTRSESDRNAEGKRILQTPSLIKKWLPEEQKNVNKTPTEKNTRQTPQDVIDAINNPRRHVTDEASGNINDIINNDS